MNREKLIKIAKPILFNTEMVRAILEGRKTVTRRVIKPQPTYKENDGFSWKDYCYGTDLPPTLKGAAYNFRCAAPYKPEDILYVRETWYKSPFTDNYIYRADGEDELFSQSYDSEIMDDTVWTWKPSIHMPKEAARIFLKVTDVRVERLQDIMAEPDFQKTVINICAEGLMLKSVLENYSVLIDDFKQLWNSTIKKQDLDKYGWDASPWVWVIEFERIEVE